MPARLRNESIADAADAAWLAATTCSHERSLEPTIPTASVRH